MNHEHEYIENIKNYLLIAIKNSDVLGHGHGHGSHLGYPTFTFLSQDIARAPSLQKFRNIIRYNVTKLHRFITTSIHCHVIRYIYTVFHKISIKLSQCIELCSYVSV